MRIGWICLVAAGLIAPASARAQATRSPFAAVSGVVLNDATGAPVRRAVVTLSTLDATPLEALTFSESNGAFGFTNIPPGKYRLHVELEGFQQAWFGAGTPMRPPGILSLQGGDIRYGITFRLRPLGSVSGVVTDADGDAVPNVQLRLLKAGWDRLKPVYTTTAWASTDDLGRYRFAEVLPGQYIVVAAQYYQTARSIQPEATVGQTAAQKMYNVAFYPDSARLSSAAPVPLAAGKDVDSIDFHLTTRPVAVLRGRVAPPADLPPDTNAMVNVFPQDLPDSGDQSMGAGASRPNFEFEFANLVAGPYVIAVSLSATGHDYRAVERIELPPGGQEITLHPERAIDLNGRVDQEGGTRPSGPFRVSLVPGGFPPGRGPIQVDAQPDGTFVVHNVVPGIWDINVEPIPAGGYIKAMRLGDFDVLTQDMTIGPETHEPLRIVVSARGAVVTGTVAVPRGVTRSARSIVLLAPSGRYADVLSFYARVSADDAGHFEFKGVTPGRYKLFAFEELDPTAYEDPGFLKPFEKLSEAFDVPEGGRADRQTQLILSDTLAAARN
jgi:hypothetical protein